MTFASDGLASPAGIVALTGLIAALGAIIGAVLAAIPSLRRQKEVQASVNSIHSIVNGERTATLAYQGQLVDAIKTAGGDVPASPTGTVLPAPAPAPDSPPVAAVARDGGPVG